MNRDGPWIALDVGLLRHRKLEELGRAAPRLLYIACLLHCGDELTDGYVRAGAMPRLLAEAGARRGGRACDVTALERAGLLEPVDDGWMIPSYLDWNPSRAWWEKQRDSAARRTREWRERRAGEPGSSDGNAIASESLGDGSRMRTESDLPGEPLPDPSTMREPGDGDASQRPSRTKSRTDETRRDERTTKADAPTGSKEQRPESVAELLAAELERLQGPDGVPV